MGILHENWQKTRFYVMKNQLKTEKPKSNNKEKKDIKFNPLAKLNFDFLSFYKDERLQKITGLSLLLFSAYLLISFTSFMFTWKTDQDKLFGSRWCVL
mgnify:FL=1